MTPTPDSGQLPDLLARLFRHLSPRRRRQFGFLLGLMLVSAFAEVVSLGAVLPFIAALTAPEKLLRHPIVSQLAEAIGLTSPQDLALPLTIAFVLAAVAAAGLRILLAWVSTRVAFAAGADLSYDVYRRTLYQPYPVHTARNSSVVLSGLVEKIHGATAVLLTALTFTSSIIVLFTVIVALVAMEPVVATVTAIGVGAGYAVIISPARRRLRQNSARIAQLQTRVIKSLQEGLGGIRDVLLDCSQELHCAVYREADLPARRAAGMNSFIGQSPRHATEALGMVIIAVIAFSLGRSGGLASALPTLAVLALGAQRLLPALQQAYASWVGIAGSQASLVAVLELLDQQIPEEYCGPAPAPLPLRDSIRFESMGFQYDPEGPWVLDGVNLCIRKGLRVGFVGGSGSGKSTLIDITLGLLTPSKGRMLLDGVPLEKRNLRAWQREIAHVPQSIFISDASFAENIAFAVPKDLIDERKVRDAARQAQIADFIESRPKGYATTVGERGVQLSGGQRQRIGIARALYKDAKVLVLDEATAALDNATERSVMGAIEELNRELTILIVAHRLSTVRNCDVIVELENGRIVAQGTYDDLLAQSASFRNIAGV